jgi:hypothetical protein
MHEFWVACKLWCDKRVVNNAITTIKEDIQQAQLDVERICFPLCHNDHWFMIVISFTHQEIQFAEGIGSSPPADLCKVLVQVLRECLGVQTCGWSMEARRLNSPEQRDRHSCGILALANIESQYTSTPPDYNWKTVTSSRIGWLRKCVEHYQAAVCESDQVKRSLARGMNGIHGSSTDVLLEGVQN